MAGSADQPLILLVEDEQLVSDLLKEALEDGGFHVLLATNGNAALDLLAQEAKAIAGLVSDVDLGAGPSGWEVARKARADNPQLAVVYMSGASAAHWEAEGVPGSTMLTKPFAPAQLLVAIANQLNTADGGSRGTGS